MFAMGRLNRKGIIPPTKERVTRMTSQKQTDANRRNAASSTGPKTKAGKDASRLNALKHGLGAESPILPTESEEAFAAFRDGLLKNLAPQGALENQLAEEIVDLSWRLRRASTLEHGVLARGVSAVDQAFFSEKKRRFEITEQDVRDEQFKMTFGSTDHLVQITNPDLHEDLDWLLDEARGVQRLDEGRLAQAFVDDAAGPNAITKLTRHETSLFRRRNQAIEALRAEQEARTTNSEEGGK